MSKSMRHPDLGDVVEVPDYAIEGYEQRGFEVVDDDTDADEPAVDEQHGDPGEQANGRPRPGDTTSETAPTPGSDDGDPAVTPAG